MNKPRSYTTLVFLLTAFFLIPGSGGLFAQTLITTVAGIGGSPGFSGDGGPATGAQLNNPSGLCFDLAGNMYIGDYFNNRIRKVDGATGIISTIAGTGAAGFSGDGGPALSAQFNHPSSLYADKNNRLFVVDYNNLRVRMIDLTTGLINTVAGNGTEIYTGGALALNDGLLPMCITMDKTGNLFISQHEGSLITYYADIVSKLDMTTGIITTIAGNGTPGFSGDGGPALGAQFGVPEGLAFDNAGNLFIADFSDGRVRRIDAATGIITTVAGDGGMNYHRPDETPALLASFESPTYVLIDGSGNLILVDQGGGQVSKIDLFTGLMTAIAGGVNSNFGPDCVPAMPYGLDECFAAAFDVTGNLYLTENSAHRVREVFTPPIDLSSLVISAQVNAVCVGSPITITSMVTNATIPFSYQWEINGKDAGDANPSFTSSSVHDGDAVTCELVASSTGKCPIPSMQTSNSLVVHILPFETPAVLIFTPTTVVCQGSPVKFIATDFQAGKSPGFQWTLNGNPVGGNSNSYTSSGLTDKDVVGCQMTVDPTTSCTTTTSAVAPTITMTVNSDAPPSIKVNASANPICEGDTVQFTAAVQNAGTSPSYQWQLNGANVGSNLPGYSNAHLRDGDIVGCLLTGDNVACAISGSALSNPLTVSVNQPPVIDLQPQDTILPSGRQLTLRASVTGALQSWQWTPAGDLTDPLSLTPLTTPMTSTTPFQLTVLSAEGCQASKTVLVKVYIKLAMPNSFTPNGDGKNDLFRIPPSVGLQLKEFAVFSRWGNRIFSTNNIGQGWDGSSNGTVCPPGTYVWFINGSNKNGPVFAKGTVILVR